MSPKSVADGLTRMTGSLSPSGLGGARPVASVPSFSCSSVSVDIKAFKGKGAFRSLSRQFADSVAQARSLGQQVADAPGGQGALSAFARGRGQAAAGRAIRVLMSGRSACRVLVTNFLESDMSNSVFKTITRALVAVLFFSGASTTFAEASATTEQADENIAYAIGMQAVFFVALPL